MKQPVVEYADPVELDTLPASHTKNNSLNQLGTLVMSGKGTSFGLSNVESQTNPNNGPNSSEGNSAAFGGSLREEVV